MAQRAMLIGITNRMMRLRRSLGLVLVPALLAAAVDARETAPEVEAFWQSCMGQSADAPDFYRVRYFGSDVAIARRLLDLIASGQKTVTFTTPWVYEGNLNQTPVLGGYTVVTDFYGHPEVVLRTTGVKTVRFSEVTEAESQFEGPGARTQEEWRRIHWAFFTNALKPLGKQPSEDMPVTVEYFEVVCKAGEDQSRR
jgi:uncharacterized protein YhfF